MPQMLLKKHNVHISFNVEKYSERCDNILIPKTAYRKLKSSKPQTSKTLPHDKQIPCEKWKVT